MSTKYRDHGGPAFPAPGFSGMSLRDYFAASVMPTLRATYPEEPPENVAKWSYSEADAMLAARKDRE